MRTNELQSLEDGRQLALTYESDSEPLDENFADEFHSYLGNGAGSVTGDTATRSADHRCSA